MAGRPNKHPAGPSGSDAAGPSKRPKLVLDNTAQNVAAKLEEKQREVEELRRQLLEKESKLLKQKQEEAAAEAARAQKEHQQKELLRKRQQLNKGFSSVAGPSAASTAAAAADGGSPKPAAAPRAPAVGIADEQEVARVIQSTSDYACLKLHVGASLSQVKKSYRQMAIALHPDKCRLEGAATAFQRIGTAYANLSKLLGG